MIFNVTYVFRNNRTSLTHGGQPFFRSRQLCSHSSTSQHFMELEGSLPCSQEPSTGPYPKPDQSNPYHSISLRSILILFTHIRLGLPSGSFLLAFPSISYMHSTFPPFVLHALPIASIELKLLKYQSAVAIRLTV
jgi:hypothetical protein